MAKEVATKEEANKAIAANNDVFAGIGGMGLENVTARDLLIPRISILQGLSPQLIKSKPEYNPDAKAGQIYDIGLGEILGDELLFLPILFKMQWLEWYPRASQKGLAKIHDTNDILSQCTPDDKGRPILPNGNYIAETAQFFGMNLLRDNRLSFLPMASTQLKKARQWNTLATQPVDGTGGKFTPPLFYWTYKLTTVPESNAEGDWNGWKIEKAGRLMDMEGGMDMIKSLMDIHKQISSGALKGDTAGLEGEAVADNNGAM